MTREEFYAECAALLQTEHEGEPFSFRYRTRWNNRKAGQGRFDGRGTIRVFGETVHISLREPAIHRTIEGMENALIFLRRELDVT